MFAYLQRPVPRYGYCSIACMRACVPAWYRRVLDVAAAAAELKTGGVQKMIDIIIIFADLEVGSGGD
jgi:hypothetical protein